VKANTRAHIALAAFNGLRSSPTHDLIFGVAKGLCDDPAVEAFLVVRTVLTKKQLAQRDGTQTPLSVVSAQTPSQPTLSIHTVDHTQDAWMRPLRACPWSAGGQFCQSGKLVWREK
jgi:hypothetical protein